MFNKQFWKDALLRPEYNIIDVGIMAAILNMDVQWYITIPVLAVYIFLTALVTEDRWYTIEEIK